MERRDGGRVLGSTQRRRAAQGRGHIWPRAGVVRGQVCGAGQVWRAAGAPVHPPPARIGGPG